MGLPTEGFHASLEGTDAESAVTEEYCSFIKSRRRLRGWENVRER